MNCDKTLENFHQYGKCLLNECNFEISDKSLIRNNFRYLNISDYETSYKNQGEQKLIALKLTFMIYLQNT